MMVKIFLGERIKKFFREVDILSGRVQIISEAD